MAETRSELEIPSEPESRVAELVNRLGRAVHCIQFAHGLNPAQWETLRYVARANRYSRTPTALAAYLGTTKGTVSQTVKALEAKGYLRRGPQPADRRACRLDVTDAGLQLLGQDPIRHIESALGSSGLEIESALVQLDRMLRGMRSACGSRSFGVCECCDHFRDAAAVAETAGLHRCGLTGEPLSNSDKTRICVDFRCPEDGT